MRRPRPEAEESFDQQEARSIAEFSRHFQIRFNDPELLRLALTHRSYLSVTGMGPRESNERLEFLGDSVLGLVTSEYLYRHHPDEHEGQLTKTKSLLVSKAILSRRALAMGLGRFILMSHSEMESGGRRRASILCDGFEAVLGAVYLDQGFEAARHFVVDYLLRGSHEIVADKRHRNYKSQLQEYVQSTFHTHPVYRIRSQMGPDHSKLFLVEVMVGRRVLGEGRGPNKKEAEQGAARDAIEHVAEPGGRRGEEPVTREPRGEERHRREPRPEAAPARVEEPLDDEDEGRRGRRGGEARTRTSRGHPERGAGRQRSRPEDVPVGAAPAASLPSPPPGERVMEVEPRPGSHEEDDVEEVGRPEGPPDARVDGPFETGPLSAPVVEAVDDDDPWDDDDEEPLFPEGDEDEQESVDMPSDEHDPDIAAGEPPQETAEPHDQVDVDPAWREPEPPPASAQFGRKRQRRR